MVKYNDFFSDLGYSSMNILDNLGSMIFLLFVIILITVLSYFSLLIPVHNLRYICFSNIRLFKLRGWICRKVLLSMIFSFLVEGFLDLLICSTINIVDFGNQGTKGYKSSGMISGLVISLIMFAICLPAPILLFFFLMKNR